ncbi:cell surface protein [Bifidobacterium longum]|nr:FctA domain-containing protein [Bifidobacterium longum]MCH4846269.1 cell surface protein [Bifidobacterium longum]
MKPGLRKVAALILATATMFGGGALSASTALADDLMVDSFTQVQADTSNSGNADTDSGDIQSDITGSGNADSQTQSDVHSDTSVRAQSAPEAAPDVTVHDMLDTDSAAVSRLRLIDRITGTAPFDNDNERGDDKDVSNDIVRSFDDVIYDYDYTVTPDSTMDYYKRTRVGFRFELPYPADKVTFDTDQMGWVDQTPGYQPKLTTETVNGVQTQVYTCYRLLEPTSNNPTVNPGTSAISLAVAVKGAPHGYKFHPTVKAWTAWDASNPTNTGTHKQAEDTPQDVTVSAKLNLNVRLGNFGKNDAGVYDFNTDQKEAPFANIGKVTGYLHSITSTVEVRWLDRSKGMKGLEMPTGKISYHIHVQNAYKDDTSDAKEKPLEERWQPYFYADNDFGNCGIIQRNVVNLDNGESPNCAAAVTTDAVKKGDNEYKVARTKTGLDIQVTFDGYDTSKFPSANANNGPYNNKYAYLDSSKKIQQVGPIHVNQFRFVVPTEYNGKTVSKIYGVDQISHNTITEGGLQASTATEDKISDENDSNAGQSITNDDTAGVTSSVRMSGWFAQTIRYSTMNSWVANDDGMSGHWANPDANNGSDIVLAGSTVGVQLGYRCALSDNETAPVTGMTLGKFDPSVLGPATEDSSKSDIGFSTWGARIKTDSTTGNKAPRFWGVKKDGTTWKSDDEQRKATIKDLNFYPTLSEAKQHGVIVAVLVYEQSSIDPENSSLGRNFFLGTKTPMTVRDDAVGKVAQITADTYVWTRKDLTKLSGLSVDDDNVKWAQWVGNYKSPLDLYKDMSNPSDTNSSESYTKSTFDENGVYQGGDTADILKGDSLFVTTEIPHISKSTEQTDDTGKNHKNIYDLDKEQRYADWLLTATADTETNSTGETYTTDYHIKDVVPKGLTYVDGSSYIGGTYKENNKGQERGTVTGGTPVAPKVTKNDDGTTTLEWVVTNVQADSSTKTLLHYSTTIGDASDPDNDAKNNQQYANHVEIRSKRAMGTPLSSRGQKADYTIRVSRTHSSALATRANPLLNDIHSKLGFTNMLGNFSKDEKTDPYAVDVMPYRGLNQSNYHGDYTLAGLTVKAGAGASMNGVKVYFTTDQKWRNVDATKITREQVQQWTEATVNATTGKVTIPDGYSKPVAWAFTSPSLPANARYDFSLSIKPTGNKAADAYVNRWTDGDNKVDAVTQVVERKVNGVAWFDTNHDGIRQDSDRLLADVTVTLVDGNGRTVTSVDGKPCTTVTDRNGHYEIGSIPAGSGFKLRFTPKTGTAWHGQNVTVKNAKDASEATDSDSDREDDSHGNMVAGVITLKPFPALDEMTSAVYEDPNEDHGMSGTLIPTTPATFKAVKVLDGRPNGAWTDRDRYVADITALDGAPANAVPSTITFADNRTQTLQINSNAFPTDGVYRYQVKERKGDNAGVTYDSRTWILTVTVTDDLTTFTRRITANTTCDGVQSDAIQFTNTYKAQPVSVQFRARKTLNDPDHTGIRLQAGQYEFTVEDKTGGQAGTAKTNDQRGDVLFDAISYTRPGTYDYTIRETPGDRGGVTYDTTKHHVRVTVTDNGEGQLLADVKYDGGTAIPEFTNTYRAQPATDTPTAVKAVSASEGNHYKLKGDDFTFTLHRVTAPDGVTTEADQTKTNDARGNIRFDQLSFPLPGTYVYTVSERDGAVPGITKDGTVTTITYTVKDVDHAGRLKVVDKTITRSDGETVNGIRFDNTYNPKGVGYTLGGVKTIINTDTATNRIPRDGEFTFKLTSHDGAPMPEGSKDGVKTVTNTGTGFAFGRMDYSKPGTYVYTVTEQADRDPTIGYSTQAYDVTVTVTDQGGMLTATADRQANDIRFDNTYTPLSVDVTVKADKHLTGRALNDGEFTAELKDMDGNTLQSKQFKRATGSEVKADEGYGTLAFDKLTFGKTGIYRYTVDETDTQLGGVTYDTTSHTVTVTVTEDAASHTLTAKTEYSTENGSEDGIRFDNTYQPQNVLVELAARKRLTGRELKADEFEFELVDKDNKVIDSARNDKDGDIRFKPLTYGRDNNGIDDCGEHRYVIRERNTGEKNVTYDRTEHHVTVTVGDDLQGNLTAKVEYDPTDDTAKDSSAMPATPTDKTKRDAIGDKPSAIPGMVTVTGTRPEFNNSYIPPVTPAIVKTIRQLAKTGVSAPIVALSAFTLLGVGLMLFRRRGNQTETARHRK